MKTSKEQSTHAPPKAGFQAAAPAQATLARQLGNAGLLRVLQAKLTVSDPQDPFEREADRVADQVMRMPAVATDGTPAPAAPQTTTLQRAADATSALPVVDAATEGAVAALDGRGRPLSPEVRSFMEPRFGADLSAVRIHTDAHAHDLARSVNARALTVGSNVVFGAGDYAPQTESGRRLIAHELTHTLQQAATMPRSEAGKPLLAHEPAHVGRQAANPERSVIHRQPKPSPGAAKLAGVVLGTNRKAEKVTVTREIGGGYDDRWQATAVVRLAKAQHGVALLGSDGRWHTLETNADFEPGKVSKDPKSPESIASGNAFVVEVYGIPPLSAIGSATTVGQRAAAILGVPESDVNSIPTFSSRVAGKINILGLPDRRSPGGGHAPMGGETDFKENTASAFWLDVPELDKPRAAETLFHETQHLKDWELAQTWVNNYTKESGRLFVKSATKYFKEWLEQEAKKKGGRLTLADVELILSEVSDSTAYTEARANVRSFIADLQAGQPDLATKAIVGYAHNMEPQAEGGFGRYSQPAPKSQVIVPEVKAIYAQMPEPMKRQDDDAIAAAIADYPASWLTELDFSKRGTRK